MSKPIEIHNKLRSFNIAAATLRFDDGDTVVYIYLGDKEFQLSINENKFTNYTDH